MFMSVNKYGWSESYVINRNSPSDAIGPAGDLIIARRKILAWNVELTYLRLSDVSVFRDSRVITLPPGTSKAYQPELSGEPWTVVLARLEGTDLYRKNIYLRGVPDDVLVATAAGSSLSTQYDKDVKAFLAHLIKNQWGFMVRDRNPALQGQVTDVDGITAPGVLAVTTKVAHGLADGDKVIIRGVKGPKAANGVHEVRVTGAGGVTKFLMLGVDDTRLYVSGGVWRFYSSILKLPDSATIVRVAKRDTGRPFDSPHGRRLTRKP
jgi:hypothetical protein